MSAVKSAGSCPGIEIEPDVYSDCNAAETGARDCPVCGPKSPCHRCGQPELDVITEAHGVCDDCYEVDRIVEEEAGKWHEEGRTSRDTARAVADRILAMKARTAPLPPASTLDALAAELIERVAYWEETGPERQRMAMRGWLEVRLAEHAARALAMKAPVSPPGAIAGRTLTKDDRIAALEAELVRRTSELNEAKAKVPDGHEVCVLELSYGDTVELFRAVHIVRADYATGPRVLHLEEQLLAWLRGAHDAGRRTR